MIIILFNIILQKYKFKDSDREHDIHLQIWDTAGHERLAILLLCDYFYSL